MQQSQTNTYRKLNLDAHPKYIKDDEAFFKLNIKNAIGRLSESSAAMLGVGTGLPSNYPACEVENAAGENYVLHTYNSKRTNETYYWVHNTNGVHYIARLSENGECQICYLGDCLDVRPEPEHRITDTRAYMKVEALCANRDGKELIWTDGRFVGMLDVEASIATDFFSTPFFKICEDRCAYISMCVPEIYGCIHGEFVPISESDKFLQNNIVDIPIQVMVRHVYYDGRASEWSDRSTTYYKNTKGCFDGGEGFSRCIKFRIPIGNPMVDKIEFAFSKDNGKTWLLADTIEKYEKYNNQQQKWYERGFAPIITDNNFNEEDCSFDYHFCNDKQCEAIQPSEYTRVRNPFPRNPQGIIEVNNLLGFYNYEDGVCPIDKSEIKKISISTDCDDNSGACQPEMAKVIVRAVIHSFRGNDNQCVFRYGGDANAPDDKEDKAYFGGLESSSLLDRDAARGMKQEFGGKSRNFIAYIEGHGTYYNMKQFRGIKKIGAGGGVEVGVMSAIENTLGFNTAMGYRNTDGYYQQAEFRVPRGTKGFIRLCSHKEESLNENSSTHVAGTMDINEYRGNFGGFTELNPNTKPSFKQWNHEILFDTTSGDVELNEVFVIEDHARPNGGALSNTTRGYSGYVKDNNNRPVEGAEVWGSTEDFPSGRLMWVTDHNGYYSFNYEEVFSNGHIRVERDCGGAFQQIMNISTNAGVGEMAETDYTIRDTNYANDFYQTVISKIEDCFGNPISGVRVALSGSKWRITDSDGTVRFFVRNYPNRVRKYVSAFINYNGCFTGSCVTTGCVPVTTVGTGVGDTCFQKQTKELNVIKISTENFGVNNRGLKSGGRYTFAVIVQGDCGRLSAAYETNTIDVPKIQQTGKLSFCPMKYSVVDGIELPYWANSLKIVRSENLNQYILQWVIDKVERTSDGNIKLTIQSLNDYNEKYFFKTNTKYQWLEGDRVEFIRDSNGAIMGSNGNILNYITLSPFNDTVVSGIEAKDDANFFNQLVIRDDGKLNDLKEGAVIEIQRIKECISEPVFHEICANIPLKPVYDSIGELSHMTVDILDGNFETFDTFFVKRTIGTFNGFTFEHHSPSDFWGDHVSDIGKAHFENKYENEKRNGRWLTLNSASQPNYFGDSVKKFDADVQGDIVAMNISDGKLILAVCEKDNFMAEASDELLRVGNDGVIRALPPDSIISNPQSKIFGTYGCRYEDIGSVYFGDGYAVWADSINHVFVRHDYQSASPITEKRGQDGSFNSQVGSYFRKALQDMVYINSGAEPLDRYFVIVGMNMEDGNLYITKKTPKQSGINNGTMVFEFGNETLVYDPIADDAIGFASFTPESYARISVFDGNGCGMLSFLNGVPYIHPLIAESVNQFYGVECDMRVGVCINKFIDKVKIPLSFEVQDSTMKWFVSKVETDLPNFDSEVPPVKVKKTEGKWNGAFLGNKNTRGGLYGGELPRGFYCKVLFTRDNTDSDIYGSINIQKRTKYSEIDLILFKFKLVEQTGFNSQNTN